jgi:hypothetical protein
MAIAINGTSGITFPDASVQTAAPPAPNYQVFTSSGTFNVPAGVTRVKVSVIGAGGNGGFFSSCVQGGGGGAGGYVVDYVAVTPGGTATVTVGTNAGTRTSSFAGGSTITAAGGSNGEGGGTGNLGLSAAASVFGQTYYLGGFSRSFQSGWTGTVGVTNIVISGTRQSVPQGSVYGHGFGVGGATVSSANPNQGAGLGMGAGGGGQGDSSTVTARTGSNGGVIVEW